jgi:hypothetical protein
MKDTVTRVGTARALVMLAAALASGAAVLLCLVILVFGPALLDRSGLTGAVVVAAIVFAVVVIVFAIVGSLLAARGRTVGSVVVRGCGMLLTGIMVGLTVLLLLISSSA